MEMTFASLCRTILMLQKSITNAKIISAWQQYSLMENFRRLQEIKIIGICRTGIAQAGVHPLFVLVNDLSDHLPIMLCTDFQPWTCPNPPLTSRRLVNVNNSALSQFQGSLNIADWSDVMREVCKNNDPSTSGRRPSP